MKPLLAIFDIDGTLVDSQAHIAAAMDHAHDVAGIERRSRERVLEIVGLSLPEAFDRLHPALTEAARNALVLAYKEAFSALRLAEGYVPSPLFPGVLEGIERIVGAGHVLGAATGKSWRGLRTVFDTHEIGHHFTTLQTADDHPSKPHPAMLMAALDETGGRPERAVMIGDTEYDIVMGRAAGVRTIGVAWGYHAPDRLRAAGADAVATDFPELERLITELAA
jgi:phosphoglycolate phosphatase